MTEQELNKACDWLKDHIHIGSPEKTGNIYATTFLSITPDILYEFRKAMTAKTNPTFERCLANVNPETRAEVRKNIDLANLLTWQDVKRIVNIADDIVSNYRESHGVIWDEQAYYKEVLNRFNNKKYGKSE